MPLTWNIGEIAIYKDDINSAYIERHEGKETYLDLVPVTKHFIFWGGAVGIGHITESNASEYYGRSKTVEDIIGQSFMQEWKKDENDEWQIDDIFMTMQHVKDHINLSTNHGTRNLTEWIKIFVRNNSTVSPEPKIVRTMVNYHKYQYERWNKKNEITN